MTDKLHCPWCETELHPCSPYSSICPNAHCKGPIVGVMSNSIWQALIDGKKAQDALKVADNKVKIAKTALSDIKNICERGQTLTYHEKSAIWADAHGALNAMAIATITKGKDNE